MPIRCYLKCQAVLLVALVVFTHFTPEAECAGETAILNFLEQLRVRMCHPIPQLGLPALDPLHITHVEGKFNNKYLIDFTGSATDFMLTGLSDFIINNFKLNAIRKSIFNITLPYTAFKSIYTAKGSLGYILNLSGEGNAEAFMQNFGLQLSFNQKTGKYLGIRNLNIQIQIGGVYIDFENLLEEERINDFFHALINELGLELLGDLWMDKNAFVEQYLQERVNAFIGQYTLGDVIKLIGGSGGEGEPIFSGGPPGDCKIETTTVYTTTDMNDNNESTPQ